MLDFNRREKVEWVRQKVPRLEGGTYHAIGMTTITQDILQRELEELRAERFAEFIGPALDQALLGDLIDEEVYALFQQPKKIANILNIACIVTIPTKLYEQKELLNRAFDSGIHLLWEERSNGQSSVTPKVQIQESTRYNPKLPRAVIMIIIQYTRIEAMRMWAHKARLREEFVVPDIDPTIRTTEPLNRFAGVTTKEAQVEKLSLIIQNASRSALSHHTELLEGWKTFFTTTSAPGRGAFQVEEDDDE